MTKEKHPFSLSLNNWIFFVVVAIIAFVAQYAKSEKSFFGVAESAGAVFATFIIPAFIAILFWLLRGKRKNGGRRTFNVVLFLLLLSQLATCSRDVNERVGEDIGTTLPSQYQTESKTKLFYFLES